MEVASYLQVLGSHATFLFFSDGIGTRNILFDREGSGSFGHKDHKVWILRLTVLQWMSESMVPPGAPAGHPTGVAPSTTTTSSKFGGSLWLTAPEGVGVTQLGGCFFFEIFQRLNSQAIRFSRFFLKLEQKHLWRIFGERNGKFKLIY